MSGNRTTESRKAAARADGAAAIAARTATATASDAGTTTPANIPDVNHYAYRIRWDGKSERFVASCAELPDVTFESDSQLEAFVGIRNAAEAEVKRLAKAGEEAPEPLSERRFSGRILVRIPPELHRALTIEAAEQHISLNRLISNRLAG